MVIVRHNDCLNFEIMRCMMEFPDVAKLNSYYGTPEKIAFREGPGGFPVIALANGSGACEVSLYGGHVLSYRPIGRIAGVVYE